LVVARSCSQVEDVSELRLSHVGFVVDLDLLDGVDLGLDAILVVLEGELLLHASARVGSISDEASLDETAAICFGGFEIKNDIAWLVVEGCGNSRDVRVTRSG